MLGTVMAPSPRLRVHGPTLHEDEVGLQTSFRNLVLTAPEWGLAESSAVWRASGVSLVGSTDFIHLGSEGQRHL